MSLFCRAGETRPLLGEKKDVGDRRDRRSGDVAECALAFGCARPLLWGVPGMGRGLVASFTVGSDPEWPAWATLAMLAGASISLAALAPPLECTNLPRGIRLDNLSWKPPVCSGDDGGSGRTGVRIRTWRTQIPPACRCGNASRWNRGRSPLRSDRRELLSTAPTHQFPVPG